MTTAGCKVPKTSKQGLQPKEEVNGKICWPHLTIQLLLGEDEGHQGLGRSHEQDQACILQ